jgi:hypothetical protein
MTLAEIATVSGKGGLFKVLAPTKSGVILESLDESKTKLVATTNNKLSLLNEISIYTTTKEGTVALGDVLKKIKKEYGDDLGVDANADGTELKAFVKSVIPDFDETRVYTSDMKKLVKWYYVLLKYAPGLLEEEKESAKEEKSKSEASEVKESKAEKKEAAEKKETAAPKAEKTSAKKSEASTKKKESAEGKPKKSK